MSPIFFHVLPPTPAPDLLPYPERYLDLLSVFANMRHWVGKSVNFIMKAQRKEKTKTN